MICHNMHNMSQCIIINQDRCINFHGGGANLVHIIPNVVPHSAPAVPSPADRAGLLHC